MARVLKKNPDKDFWQLSKDGLLPKQSIQYVPKLIAISDIIENADYYELDDILEAANLIEGKEVEEYDSNIRGNRNRKNRDKNIKPGSISQLHTCKRNL